MPQGIYSGRRSDHVFVRELTARTRDDSRLGGAAHELLGKYVSELLVSSQNP